MLWRPSWALRPSQPQQSLATGHLEERRPPRRGRTHRREVQRAHGRKAMHGQPPAPPPRGAVPGLAGLRNTSLSPLGPSSIHPSSTLQWFQSLTSIRMPWRSGEQISGPTPTRAPAAGLRRHQELVFLVSSLRVLTLLGHAATVRTTAGPLSIKGHQRLWSLSDPPR